MHDLDDMLTYQMKIRLRDEFVGGGGYGETLHYVEAYAVRLTFTMQRTREILWEIAAA